MSVRTAPPRPRPSTRPAPTPDPALDDALAHIGSLAERLWAVRRLHVAGHRRCRLGRARVVCAACGQALPCPTLRAVDPR